MTDVLIFDSEAPYYTRELSALFPDLAITGTHDPQVALAEAGTARVLVGLAPYLPQPVLEAAKRLEWIQALTTGVDNLLTNPGLRGVALTNCSGIHGPQMSELAMLLMLASVRRFPAMLDNQHARHWERWKQPILQGRRVCIVGLGAIAEHIAGVCAAFGMSVTGVSDGRAEVPGFARVYRRAELAEAANEADFLVVLVPYSAQTHHIINADVLAAMRPDAWLINIARGGCVDEEALLAVLRSGSIAGAALDVFATTPLPANSPFWSMPNVIVTPHIGGFSATYHEQALPVVARNMADWRRGGTAALTGRLDKD
ncbi:MAG: D-2-hydroxyacid dehydrogenase [Pararhodobacter sp.]